MPRQVQPMKTVYCKRLEQLRHPFHQRKNLKMHRPLIAQQRLVIIALPWASKKAEQVHRELYGKLEDLMTQ